MARHFTESVRQSRRWGVVALSLLLMAAVSLTVGLSGQPGAQVSGLSTPQLSTPQLTAPSAGDGTGPSRSAHPGAAPRADGVDPLVRPRQNSDPVAPRSAPVGLRIPAIDLETSLSELGLNPDRTVQVPTNFAEPGWFRLGPTPGQVGSAVILGHVDSREGPAVFYLLRFLKAGDRIAVSLADGRVAHFVVDKVGTYPNEDFPARQVYASHGYSALQLVTCGGDFDIPTDSYQANVVVFTSLYSVTSQSGPLTTPGRSTPRPGGGPSV